MPQIDVLRIGLFGGTFNPIHNGHLSIIEYAIKNLKLDKLLIIPVGIPPHKHQLDHQFATYDQRLKMIAIALADIAKNSPKIEISQIDRPQTTIKFNWTYDLLNRIRKQYPVANLLWLMGIDSFLDLPNWKNWQQVVMVSNFVVFNRNIDGDNLLPAKQQLLAEISNAIENKTYDQLIPTAQFDFGQFEFVDFPPIEVAGIDIRTILKQGNHQIDKSAIPNQVLEYIRKNKIYNQ